MTPSLVFTTTASSAAKGSLVSEIGPSPPDVKWPDPSWAPAAVGRRVTVRRATGETGPTGGPAYRDVVGILVDITGNLWSIKRRTGETVTVDPSVVVAAKVVPAMPARPRTALDIDVGALEELAALAWQPLEQEPLGEWTLRAAKGFTGRANSVLPLGEPGRPLDEALAVIRRWYEDRSLPATIQVPMPLCRPLDTALAERGWVSESRVAVMVTDLDPLRMAASAGRNAESGEVEIAPAPDAAWLAAFRYGDRSVPPEVVPIMMKASHPVFGSVRGRDNTPLAIGRGAIDGRWLGVTALEVAPAHRRQGLGRHVISALAEYAAAQQCRHVWLQVASDNEPAQALYTSLGFVEHHHYVYRRLTPRRR